MRVLTSKSVSLTNTVGEDDIPVLLGSEEVVELLKLRGGKVVDVKSGSDDRGTFGFSYCRWACFVIIALPVFLVPRKF